jgi:hypothetical protein
MNETIEDQIRLGLRLLADDVQPPAGAIGRRFPTNRRVGVAAALAIAVLIAGVWATLTFTGNGHSRSGPGAVKFGPDTLGVNPYGTDGAMVSLDQLTADISYAFPLPDSPLANSGNLGAIWEDTASHAFAIYYPSSGIQLSYGGTGVDFTGVPESWIVSIGGIKSLVIPAGTFGTEDKYTQVSVPLPGSHLVTVAGAGSVADETSVAASIVSNLGS